MGISSCQDQALELELGQHPGEPGLLQSPGSGPEENPGAARSLGMEWGGFWAARTLLEAPLRLRFPFLGEFPVTLGCFDVTTAFVTSSSYRINPGFNNSSFLPSPGCVWGL